MVLSFASMAFRQQHLELNSHPKDLHRDYLMRRVSYGNSTHLNISIIVGNDNKAVLKVVLITGKSLSGKFAIFFLTVTGKFFTGYQ
jgi:hypothetical protein